jgi:fumarate reductase subunit D
MSTSSGRLHCYIRAKSGKKVGMGILWGLFKAVTLVFAVIIAVLVVIDGSLLANLLGKKNE